jgi:molecular chaperone Hsp33
MNDTTKTGETIEFQSDILQRFIFDNAHIRGEWVHLKETWQEVLSQRDYPIAVQKVLGDMMVSAALLAATVKMKGRLVLQVKSSGPVSLLMVECTSDNTLRAFAQWDGEIADNASLLETTGEGTLAITIEVEGAKQPYQGVVSLQGDSFSNVLEVYFLQSEQLETRIWLSSDRRAAAGLLLQQLPNDDTAYKDEEESWSRISQLAATVTPDELVKLGSGTLLHRLFHEEECRLLDSTELRFSCQCSRERVAETIGLLGKDDALDLIEDQGSIEVACEFCNEHYHFDRVDVMHLFADDAVPTEPESPTLH